MIDYVESVNHMLEYLQVEVYLKAKLLIVLIKVSLIAIWVYYQI